MLEGVKVLSFTHYLQGPSAAQTLADLGADVVKIESPKGAFERSWSGCDTYKNGVSVFFMLANRNQRSMAIDLKSQEGQLLIYDLVKEFDVVIENFRPGVMDKLGFDFEQLKKINPKIIYCSCSGYGSTGPYLKKPGQDLLAQSLSGMIAITGRGCDPPTPIGTTAIDQHGATLAALGILAAIIAREKTGKGCRVDACLLNAAIDLQLEPFGYYLNDGNLIKQPDTGLSTRIHNSPYGVYKTADGFLTVSLNPYEKLAEVFEDGALSGLTPKDQMWNRAAFDKIVAEQMLKRTTADWIKIFDEFDLWYAPINEYADVVNDPQVKENEVILEIEHPVAGMVKVINHPVRYDGKPPALRLLPPDLGEHSAEVLQEVGYSDEKIKELLTKGVIHEKK